jgi:hypothetical protein
MMIYNGWSKVIKQFYQVFTGESLMRKSVAILLVLLVASAISGCRPSVSDKDLGTVVYEIPRVKGADQPYELPKVLTPSPESGVNISQELGIVNLPGEEGVKANPEDAEMPSQQEVKAPDESKAPDNSKRPRPTPAHRP